MPDIFKQNGKLFDYFQNWFAFPAGPVENDIYFYWYQKSIKKDYTLDGEKYKLADRIRELVNYEGVRSKNKYNLKMLYFCCLLEKFYEGYGFDDEKKIVLMNYEEKIPHLVKNVEQLLSNFFENKYKIENYKFTADDLIWLSHNLELWFDCYSPEEYKKIPMDKIEMEAMAFYLKVA